MRRVLLFFCVISSWASLNAQEENWNSYLAQYENGAGTVLLDMNLISVAPIEKLPIVLITGVKFNKCDEDGFPVEGEFDRLYSVSDKVVELVQNLASSKLAGSFIYQCERLDYIYVSDTSDLREGLTRLYESDLKEYQPYINIRLDEEWLAYRSFLYPNEETQEYMANQSVLFQLQSNGDNLTKSRKVDHYAYFNNSSSRESFMSYVKEDGYMIDDVFTSENSSLRFGLHFSKNQNVQLDEISAVTMALKNKAKEVGGEYDGWETIVVR